MTPCSCAMEIIIASFRGKLVRPLFFQLRVKVLLLPVSTNCQGPHCSDERSQLIASKIQLGNLSLKLAGYTIFVAHPMEHFMFYRLMAGEFRGWLIPSSSLSSAVSNFQRISNLLVGPFVCRKRRSFFIHRSTRSGRILRFNCLGLLWYGLFSIGRFFVTHGERFFVPKKSWQTEDSSCACW